ncbi:hypothetical protein [Polaribacter vadi]|uniref:hypothetical protein n=1 Tax=Polaribacter vadi TaxID=1774273 RepID=UPI0030EB7280|tara:strand:- start:451 stop:870 length:420 start_codon:yes stop_codon:yes gene_type:complete
MKIFFIILSTLFFAKGCSNQINIEEVEIQYVAETRGYYYSIKIEDKNFYVINARNDKPKEVHLSKNEWNILSKLFNEIDLTTFEKLIGETNERDFDKRPFGNLFITKNDKKIQTKGFDHTIPPREIKPFIDLILQYSKK